jgi:hypothetical protein
MLDETIMIIPINFDTKINDIGLRDPVKELNFIMNQKSLISCSFIESAEAEEDSEWVIGGNYYYLLKLSFNRRRHYRIKNFKYTLCTLSFGASFIKRYCSIEDAKEEYDSILSEEVMSNNKFILRDFDHFGGFSKIHNHVVKTCNIKKLLV